MSRLINQLETVTLYNETLTKDKYIAVKTQGNKLRNIIYKHILNNDNAAKLENVDSRLMIYFPTENKLRLKGSSSIFENYIMCTWISEEVFKECGNDYCLLLDSIQYNEVKDKNTITSMDKYLMISQMKNPKKMCDYINKSSSRYVTLQIGLKGNYKVNANVNPSHHMGLYIIDKILKKTYFFDPNGCPKYFENIRSKFGILDSSDNFMKVNSDIVDDISLTYNELAFLTNHHSQTSKTIINEFMKQYTKLISKDLTFVEDNDFYKFIPNSNLLSENFDTGSCVTWTIIMDHLLQVNSDKNYDIIIEELCRLTIMDSQRFCYSYQCGLYNMLDTYKEVKMDVESSTNVLM
ncbi:hypothetical protein Catovirus_1_557 [Catovirus CTV1]|uniref:Uncharacterized protein n=1 Tax=Catovirus CTV1 TaxID=1977631 RepID=A0A1V0S9V8_9VIRU|nr:hypothetical protein Catovirus_1_557 [Catovirus CTV1]